MEKFQKGDFIKLKNVSKFQINRVRRGEVNIFELIKYNQDFAEIRDCETQIPSNEIEPIPINGKDDYHIYYDPIVMADYINRGDPAPIRNTNYNYYFETLKNSYVYGQCIREIILKRGYNYVHEVQRFMKETHQEKALKINTY